MEIEEAKRQFVSEKSRIRQEKQDKEELKSLLFNYFYNEFKKEQENPEKIYTNLNFIRERERIIKTISENNSLTFQYLNSIYTKTLKEVLQIFKNNLVYIEEKDNVFKEEEKTKQELVDILKQVEQNKIEHERKIQEQKQQEEAQKKQERKNIIWGLINLLGYIFNPIGIIILIFLSFLIFG